MVFSEPVFLFFFLPLVFLACLITPRRLHNPLLFVASILFYCWGERVFVAVMFCSIGLNYLVGLGIDRWRGRPPARAILAVGIAGNLAMLVGLKYANFMVDNLNALLTSLGLISIDLPRIHLPIGISFFTFQAMSYVIDLHRGHAALQRSPIQLGLFISLFPQLIAGPIVRYREIAAQLMNRRIQLDRLHAGVQRFIVGLGKKTLLANPAGLCADQIFALPLEDLTTSAAWLGAVSYMLQIYFDFSGYSDMAIGLGRMFGFELPENFNYPYISASVTEFWRRWHMSLSRWFRDYLYIPLGGNRVAPHRLYVNLVTVFFLCGLWHGASWTFMIWGLYHGVFLVIERVGWIQSLTGRAGFLRYVYTLAIVLVGWVFFRSDSLAQAAAMLGRMVGIGATGLGRVAATEYLTPGLMCVLVIGTIGCMPILPAIEQWIERCRQRGPSDAIERARMAITTVSLGIVLAVCAGAIAAGTYNPFIYFRF